MDWWRRCFLVAMDVLIKNPAEPKLVRGLKTSATSTTNALTIAEIRDILQTIDKIKDLITALNN